MPTTTSNLPEREQKPQADDVPIPELKRWIHQAEQELAETHRAQQRAATVPKPRQPYNYD